jgi:hypothetical protein
MKYLILFLGFNLFAANYMSKGDIEKANQGLNGTTTYTSLKSCLDKKGEACHKIDSCAPSICSVQDTEIDDTEKPIYAKSTDNTPCNIYEDYINELTEAPQEDDCRLLISSENVGTEEEPKFEYTLCKDKTYYALYAETEEGYEAYCTKLMGYKKKIVEQLREDAALKAAKELKELEDAQAKAQKKAEKNEAKQAIEAAKGNIDKMSQQELAAIIEKLIILLEN